MKRFAIAALLLLLSSSAAADWFPGDQPSFLWKKDYNHYPACGSWSVQMPCDKVA